METTTKTDADNRYNTIDVVSDGADENIQVTFRPTFSLAKTTATSMAERFTSSELQRTRPMGRAEEHGVEESRQKR